LCLEATAENGAPESNWGNRFFYVGPDQPDPTGGQCNTKIDDGIAMTGFGGQAERAELLH
jgi:hypothetical protein